MIIFLVKLTLGYFSGISVYPIFRHTHTCLSPTFWLECTPKYDCSWWDLSNTPKHHSFHMSETWMMGTGVKSKGFRLRFSLYPLTSFRNRNIQRFGHSQMFWTISPFWVPSTDENMSSISKVSGQTCAALWLEGSQLRRILSAYFNGSQRMGDWANLRRQPN